jgi:hypothetical protein
MTALYLWINAALYAAFSILCSMNVPGTSSALGYKSLSPSGHSEYLTVYGGLQIGLALFFGAAAYRPEWNRPALLMALCLYAGIFLFRSISVMKHWPVEKTTLGVASLELALLIGAVWLWIADRAGAS